MLPGGTNAKAQIQLQLYYYQPNETTKRTPRLRREHTQLMARDNEHPSTITTYFNHLITPCKKQERAHFFTAYLYRLRRYATEAVGVPIYSFVPQATTLHRCEGEETGVLRVEVYFIFCPVPLNCGSLSLCAAGASRIPHGERDINVSITPRPISHLPVTLRPRRARLHHAPTRASHLSHIMLFLTVSSLFLLYLDLPRPLLDSPLAHPFSPLSLIHI